MKNSFREKLYTIIFESDTKAGRNFDLALIATIILSVVLVILESVNSYRVRYGEIFYLMEWILTIIFLAEYILRIYAVNKPSKYIYSFFGLIDLFSILSTVSGLFIPGAQSLLIIRSLRLLRIFRILKLVRYFNEGMIIVEALKASRVKISVFLFTVMIIVLVTGTAMYLIEGPKAGFVNIPISMYWAIVTLTTVGYGDIAPLTNLGRILASMLMIVGYAIIAVPTGIVTSEMTKRSTDIDSKVSCPGCKSRDHIKDSKFCRFCGTELISSQGRSI